MHSRTYAEISKNALLHNYRRVLKAAKESHSRLTGLAPMVKCNAYGHGAVDVAKSLSSEKTAIALGVATIGEAEELRQSGIKKDIWVFSDAIPWDEKTHDLYYKNSLTPIFHRVSDLKKFFYLLKAKRKKIPFHIKFNTGLNRLGVDVSELSEVRSLLVKEEMVPDGICTHFAIGEDLASAASIRQIKRFEKVLSEFSKFKVKHIHSSNSAALIDGGNHLSWKNFLSRMCTVARPGISLYGYADIDVSELNLKPVLKWKAKVLNVRDLASGETVGYGGSFRAKQKMRSAVLAVGYGDGIHRTLSNKYLYLGFGNSKPVKCMILGRVSMDLIVVALPSELHLKSNPWVTILGNDSKQAMEMAVNAKTNVYEVLTSISQRVPRIFKR